VNVLRWRAVGFQAEELRPGALARAPDLRAAGGEAEERQILISLACWLPARDLLAPEATERGGVVAVRQFAV
jgi:hypothetical protein